MQWLYPDKTEKLSKILISVSSSSEFSVLCHRFIHYKAKNDDRFDHCYHCIDIYENHQILYLCKDKIVIDEHMSHVMRKPDFCLCENKDADQVCSNCTADQRICFCHSDSTIPLLLKSKISSFQPSSVTAQASLCQTWSETQIHAKAQLLFFCCRS